MKEFPFKEISFSASGWLYIFQLGVLHYLQNHYDMKDVKVYGTSAGAIVGCSLCCDYDNLRLAAEVIQAKQIQSRDFTKMIELAHAGCDRICPTDAHIKCNERLTIACTEIHNGVFMKAVTYNTYRYRQDVVDILKATSFLPFLGGFTPYVYNKKWLIDGVFTIPHQNPDNRSCLMVSHRRNCSCGCFKDPSRAIIPEFNIPKQFSIFPVSEEFLKLMFYHGYIVAYKFFNDCHIESKSLKTIDDLKNTSFEDVSKIHFDTAIKNQELIRNELEETIRKHDYARHSSIVICLGIIGIFCSYFFLKHNM
jgi:hypothetical protein